MVVRKQYIVKPNLGDWAVAMFILGLLAMATKVGISAIIGLCGEFYLPF